MVIQVFLTDILFMVIGRILSFFIKLAVLRALKPILFPIVLLRFAYKIFMGTIKLLSFI